MNLYAIPAVLLLVIAAYFGGIHVGKQLDHEKWQQERVVLANQAIADVQAEVNKRQRLELASQANARKATENHEKEKLELRTRYAAEIAAQRKLGGLRISATSLHQPEIAVAAEAASASRFDEAAAATVKLPDRIEEGLYALAFHADATVAQCRALQQWVIGEGLYGPPVETPAQE